MFIVSKRTQYSLKALYHLSRNYGEDLVTTSRIAEAERIPRKFLEAILFDLKTHGFVNSKPGPRGGHQLALPPDQIRIGSAVRVVEGPLFLLPCANEAALRPCKDYVDADTCGTRFVMQRILSATADILDDLTLEDICDLPRVERLLTPAKLEVAQIR